ncbi:MAG: glycosyltransferase family 2 protein [Prevotella sp.]|nr:glycosyltransferase family 2 protein [Prevotella sp.]
MITIGFPVYNVEGYVHRSLTSALNQDFDDIEIIVVDDCGTDGSMAIINHLAASHPKGSRVRVIRHDENKGLAEARNTVIKNAKGQYIYFMDSDDFIIPNTLSLLYQSAEKYQADVVYGSTIKQEGDKTWTGDDDLLPDRQFLSKGEFVAYAYMTPNVHVPITVWNILFRTSFLHDNHLLFPNIRYQEDIAFNELYHPLVERAVFLPTQTYHYVIRTDSLMSKRARTSIGIEEANRAFQLCEEIKRSCSRWKGTNFYSGKCTVVMKNCFYDMGGLIKHRQKFSQPLPLKSVRNAMKHPASLSEILRFCQHRNENLFYYLTGILPPRLSVWLMEYVCQKKGFFRN